jgi:hypothetical protein
MSFMSQPILKVHNVYCIINFQNLIVKALCYIFQCIKFDNNKTLLNMKFNAKNSFNHTLILAINT